MKQISLKSGQLSKFKSFRQESHVTFPDDCSLILVAGDNKVEPRLGANGAGKSSLFDGLNFCLFGTSVNGMRIGDLVSFGEKTTGVSFFFLIDDQEVIIARSGPPTRIFINGNQVEQADVEKLIGMSRQRFLNSVLFGQAAPLFIDLSIPERGAFLDEILDFQLWMRASDKAARMHKASSAELNKLRIEMGKIEGALSVIESVEEITRNENEWKDNQDKRLAALLEEFETRESNLNSIVLDDEEDTSKLVAELRNQYDDCRERLIKTEQQVDTDRREKEKLQKEIDFFDTNETCPVCTQTITRNFVQQHTKSQKFDLAVLADHMQTNQSLIADLKEKVSAWKRRWEEATQAQQKQSRAQAELRAQAEGEKRYLDQLERQMEAVAAETNPFTNRREKVEQERALLEEKQKQQKEQETEITNTLGSYDFWREAFKRVRLFCIKTVLQQLDIEVMNAASSLGLIGWKISFTTETETKSGSIKTGVQIQVESPTMPGPFAAWSGGEGQRVRLCVSLGLASLIQRWSGVRWDVEIFDEATTWLSEQGISDLLDLLKARVEIQKKRIFVIDHRGLQHSTLDHVITVAKGPEGSYVVV
jgi:DNA repair exonuclease SbcCD ATPase subunit